MEHGEWIGDLDRALEGLILSVSGWRGIFAAGGDGESGEPGISPAHTFIAAAAGRAFADTFAAVILKDPRYIRRFPRHGGLWCWWGPTPVLPGLLLPTR